MYDSDVAHSDQLLRLARLYAMEYVGNFEPMIAYKLQVEDGPKFTPSECRHILNCLRVDTSEWARVYKTVLAKELSYYWDEDSIEGEQVAPKLRVVKPKEMPVILDMKLHVKTPYGRPKQHNGVLHLVARDQSRNFVRWTRQPDRYGPRLPRLDHFVLDTRNRSFVHVRWECGSSATSPIFLWEDPGDIRHCKKCIEAREGLGGSERDRAQ